ncbi:uncharacterized protein LOC119638318 [Glossina fuscipes]|uniref:Uncharacterized protein LOC119638318 n=1 Tax=Glossina fuscipes TaxID=7396 RepID=A0A9C6DL14_9MUSC|nr:uncharacterized protein LOC119638318 [Glossina fuscipes]XP_037890984.1 uncharacterized protein LOC119638318 [Glossina fuscipes]XP_037890985.1 uncharacterized protein LOC119638318 [Glossina fuscipes]XP_037890986.1 uncharacterized protein LOC119638318 [Glossina fuscipes]
MTESTNVNSFLSGITINAAKEKSVGLTKLMINHGKPNFTVQRYVKSTNCSKIDLPKKERSAKSETNLRRSAMNDDIGPVINSSEESSKTTPSLSLQENEQSRVVLRRTKTIERTLKESDMDKIPEFIHRQRRIQERLAREELLDFENRRSGYHIHCMITPASPSRQSFVPTMTSPAVVPALEIHFEEARSLAEEQGETRKVVVYGESRDGATNRQTDYDTRTTSYKTNGGAGEQQKVIEAIVEINETIEADELQLVSNNNNSLNQTKKNKDTSGFIREFVMGQRNEIKQLVQEITEQALATAIDKDIHFYSAFIAKR